MSENPYESPLVAEPSYEEAKPVAPISVPSPGLFRSVTTVAIVLWVTVAVGPRIGFFTYSENVAIALTWNNAEAALPGWVIVLWYYVFNIAVTAGLLGVLCFWSPARWCLAATVTLSLLLTPFLGLSVYAPAESGFGATSWVLVIWVVTVSFWSPLAKKFESRAEPFRIPPSDL